MKVCRQEFHTFAPSYLYTFVPSHFRTFIPSHFYTREAEGPMARRKVMLKYPEHLIQEPVLFRMAREFDVIPNIRRARVTDTVGEIALELDGTAENLERG